MTDDIVTRLRSTAHTGGALIGPEAADEIERLRALLYRWENCEEVIDGLCGWDSEKTLCADCKEVKND
jgi:hypothetical protein